VPSFAVDLTRGSHHLVQFCFLKNCFSKTRTHHFLFPCSTFAIFFPVWGFFLAALYPPPLSAFIFLHLALSRNGLPSWPFRELVGSRAWVPDDSVLFFIFDYPHLRSCFYKQNSRPSLTAQIFGEPPCVDFLPFLLTSSSPFIGLQDVPEALCWRY
jgi:hypothetical protein